MLLGFGLMAGKLTHIPHEKFARATEIHLLQMKQTGRIWVNYEMDPPRIDYMTRTMHSETNMGTLYGAYCIQEYTVEKMCRH